MRNEWVQYLADFHCAGGLDDARVPCLRGPKTRALRRKLLREEFREYEDAEDNGDLVAIADALADVIYVAVGTCLQYGIPIEDVMAEVQRANMSKCIDGKIRRREDGKILKPDTYSPPDIKRAMGL